MMFFSWQVGHSKLFVISFETVKLWVLALAPLVQKPISTDVSIVYMTGLPYFSHTSGNFKSEFIVSYGVTYLCGFHDVLHTSSQNYEFYPDFYNILLKNEKYSYPQSRPCDVISSEGHSPEPRNLFLKYVRSLHSGRDDKVRVSGPQDLRSGWQGEGIFADNH